MNVSSRLWVSIIFLACLASGGSAGIASAADASSTRAIPAIDFSLKDLDGKVHTLKAEKGRVVLMSFWATWCGPCRMELPKLNEVYEKLKGPNLTMFAVNVDNPDSVGGVKSMAQQLGLKFPVLLDTQNQVVNQYNGQGIIPFTVIIDQKGNVRHVHAGYDIGEEKKVEEELRALLAGASKAGTAAKKK